MSDEQPMDAPPSRQGRSLTAFYVATVVVGAVVGLGVWLWTPGRVRYWESRAQTPGPLLAPLGGPLPYSDPRVRAAQELVGLGPVALPAFQRLLASPSKEVRRSVLIGVALKEGRWAFPLVVEAANEEDYQVASTAIMVAESLSGCDFAGDATDIETRRRNLFAWWEREGRAKYGEPPK